MLKNLKNRKVLMSLIQKCLMLLLAVIIFAIGNNIFLILKTSNNFNKKISDDLKYSTSYVEQQINSFHQAIYSFRDSRDVAYFSSLNKLLFSTQQTKQISNISNGIKQTMVSNNGISNIFIGFNNIDLVVSKDGTMSLDAFDKYHYNLSNIYINPNPNTKNSFSIKQDIKKGEIHTLLTNDYHLFYYKTKKYTIILRTNNIILNEQLTLFTASQNVYLTISDPKGNIYATNCASHNSPSFNELNSFKYKKNTRPIHAYNLTSTAFFSKSELQSNLLNVNIVSITLCVLLIVIITWILYSLKCSLYDPIEKLINKTGNLFNKTVIDEYELLEESINKYGVIAKEYESYRKDVDYELEVNTLNRILSDATKANDEAILSLGKHAPQMYCMLSIDLENNCGIKDLDRHSMFEKLIEQHYHVVSVLSMTYSNTYIIYLTDINNSYQNLIEHIKNILKEYSNGFSICGISEVFDDISNAKIAYSQSQKALVSFTSSSLDSYVSIYKLRRSSSTSLPNPTDILTKIINNTLSLNYIEVETTFRDLLVATTNFTINQKRKSFLQLYDYLCIFLANKDIDSNEFFSEDNINTEEILHNTLNTTLLLDTLLSCFRRGIFSASDGKNNDLLSLIVKFIDDNIDQNISLLQLADEMNLSYTYMSKYFKGKMNMSFVEYVQIKKIRAAQDLLQSTDLNIVDIAEKMGFNTANTFFRTFKKITGVTPNEYRQQ